MKQNSMLGHHSQSLSLVSLEAALQDAKEASRPDVHRPQMDVDEQLAVSLIEKVRKQHNRPSPFASWMGQPFPDEYRELVAADVR